MQATLEHTKILKCPLLKEFESSAEERTDAYEMKAQTKHQESVHHIGGTRGTGGTTGMVPHPSFEGTHIAFQDHHVPPLKSLAVLFLLKEKLRYRDSVTGPKLKSNLGPEPKPKARGSDQ